MTQDSSDLDRPGEGRPGRALREIPGAWRFPSPQELAERFEARIRRWQAGPVEPLADVFLFENEVWIELDLPGVEEGEVSAYIEENAVWVEATRRIAPPVPGALPARLERPRGQLRRRIPLPVSAPSATLDVRLERGVLRVRILARSTP